MKRWLLVFSLLCIVIVIITLIVAIVLSDRVDRTKSVKTAVETKAEVEAEVEAEVGAETEAEVEAEVEANEVSRIEGGLKFRDDEIHRLAVLRLAPFIVVELVFQFRTRGSTPPRSVFEILLEQRLEGDGTVMA